MKKIIMLLLAVGLLGACSDNSYEADLKKAQKELEKAQEETKRLEEQIKETEATSELLDETQEEIEITEQPITKEKVKEVLEYEALGEGDKVTDVAIDNGEIKAVIKMADEESIFAETIYSSAGDGLLKHEGWEVLTIDFSNVGKISMNRNETETNEIGLEYFPLDKIIGSLRK